jgi:biotin carboxyl carrier protein
MVSMKVGATISPVCGEFHRAYPTGTKPFVEIGDLVQADTTVCIVLGSPYFFGDEEMKTEQGYYDESGLVLNRINAQIAGKIIGILATEGQTAEYGMPLFAIEPMSPLGEHNTIDWPETHR